VGSLEGLEGLASSFEGALILESWHDSEKYIISNKIYNKKKHTVASAAASRAPLVHPLPLSLPAAPYVSIGRCSLLKYSLV
jgi:hypothetical protein